MLTAILSFIVVISILVVVHEWGHYIVARMCGVKVLRFSVGFGKTLWSRRFGQDQTEFSICALPLGGYVKMLDEREAPVAEHELGRAFNRQSVGKRCLVVLAGPVANLVLAFLLYFAVFVHGVRELRPILDTPPAQTLTANTSITEGDIVLAVNDVEVQSWEEMRWEVLNAIIEGKNIQLKLEPADIGNDGGFDLAELPSAGISLDSMGTDPMRYLGLRLAPPRIPAVLGKVTPGMPAALAGLQAGDEVVAIDGKPIRFWGEMSAIISASPDKPLHLDIKRADAVLTVAVTPRLIEDQGQSRVRMGVEKHNAQQAWDAMFVTMNYSLTAAARKALAQVWESSVLSLRVMGQMLTGKLSVKNLSGPVTIAEYAGESAKLGLEIFIRFLAAISVSIGVLNLLPIPVLDGGHLMYYLAEFFRGKPLSERVFEFGQRVGLTLLLLMMSVALFNDLNRQFFG